MTESERESLRHYLQTGDKSADLRVLETRIRDNLTSGRLTEDYQFIQRWIRSYCEGKVRRYVTFGRETSQKVAKTLITMIRKENITPTEIKQILDDVRTKTVKSCSEQELAISRSKRLSELEGFLDKALR
ncbi:MAG: hypothetical protein ACLPY5_03340 [Candidatus Bathyarchaeia archaeon]